MEQIIFETNTVLYGFFVAVIWLMGRVVTLIEKTTRSTVQLSSAVERMEEDMRDHEYRLRDIEKGKIQ